MIVFVSHAHSDDWLAQALVKLIEGRFVISEHELRCTSLPGYNLHLGDTPDRTLKDELGAAKVVIGLLTASSLQSSWVLSELGASWGLNRNIICMVFPGVADEDVPSVYRNRLSVDLRSANRGPHEFATQEYAKKRLLKLLDEIGKFGPLVTKDGTDPAALAEAFVESICEYTPRFRAPHLLVTRQELRTKKPYGLRWAQIAAYALTEIRIWGWSCMNVIDGNSRNIFRDWLLPWSHRRLRVLVMNPDAVAKSQLNFGSVCGIEDDKVVVKDIREVIHDLKEWKDDPQVPGNQVELLKTNWNLTFSGVAVDIGQDAESSEGIIQSEQFSYNFGPDHLSNRLNLVVRRGSPFWAGHHKTVVAIFKSGVPA